MVDLGKFRTNWKAVAASFVIEDKFVYMQNESTKNVVKEYFKNDTRKCAQRVTR